MEITVKPSRKAPTNLASSRLWKTIMYYKYIYLILLPGIAFFVIFSYIPMYGIQIAFKDYSVSKGIFGSTWVGLEKFQMLWHQPEFWNVFKNTIVIALLKIAFGFPIPIILAILLNELKSEKYKRPLQTLYTFPHFLSWVVVSGIMINLLANEGAINNFISTMGGERVSFLTNATIFRFLIVFTDIWKEAGWSCIIYMAAIMGIDPSLYESASIDGANRWHRIFYITLPGVFEIAAVLLILAIGNIMNAGFDQIFNMYNPPVYKIADILDTYIYRQSFQLGADYGYTTAVGLFKGVINCVLLVSANSIVKKFGNTSVL